MENKENYRVKITDLSSNYIISSFYDELISTNIITTNDVNSLILSTNFCINTLSSICTDQFCQLCQNTFNYYINLTDTKFPRIKYYNNKTNSISAVFSNSTINDFYLSSTPINLISYPKGTNYNLVKSINGATGSISGIEKIIINNISYEWNIANKGKINLGNFIKLDSIVTSINNNSGVVLSVAGIKYNNAVLKSNAINKGIIDITSIINNYINNNQAYFKHLYVNAMDGENNNSVINLNYVKNSPQLQIKSKTITLTSDDIDSGTTSSIIYIDPINDDNFLSYIYGIQNNVYHQALGYTAASISPFEPNLYSNGIPITFVILDGNMDTTFNLKITAVGSPDTISLQYSKKYEPYKSFSIDDGVNFKIGEPVSLIGTKNYFSKGENDYYCITWLSGTSDVATTPCNPKFICYGNIMSLVNWNTKIKTDWQFYALFSGTNIAKAPQLPATTLCANCYDSLFQNCTNLIVPPQLPATTLADDCYRDMFRGCTSLSTVPLLPAENLAPSCYVQMFMECTSLTILPYYLLPATTLADSCYESMFKNCSNITDGPLLPATTLSANCYKDLFNGCTSLTAIHANFDIDLIGDATNNPYVSGWMENRSETINSYTYFYNTNAWNRKKDEANLEQFYYNNTFNKLNVGHIARSLEDTPLSFELISGVTDGAFCFRAQQYNLTTTVISKFSYKNKKDYVTGGVNYEGMNVKYKYYHPVSKEISGTNRDENGWKKITWDWESVPNKYTLCHDGFAFNNTTSGKNGLIFSLSSNYMSQGLDEANNRILFWRLCHQNGCKFKIMGNLNSMNGWRDNLKPYEFFALFSDDQHGSKHHTYGFVDAHQLILPAKNLNEHCYEKMFEKCSSLVNGPTSLPAMNLPRQCYCQMFANCSSLISAPSINAQNLAYRSCNWMFEGCKNLVVAPSISNFTNSENRGLKAMFYNCNKLKYCQDIVITTIKTEQCSEMFKNCTELLYPPSISTNKVEASGCAFMFNTCKDLQYIPPLLATTLGEHSYHRMFRYGEDDDNMKDLISKYVYLPATNSKMDDYCYRQMFFNTNVNYIVVKFTDWMNKKLWPNTVDYTTPPYPQETYLRTKTAGWLGYKSTVDRSTWRIFTGTFVCYPNLSIEIRDNGHIPTNWTVMNQVNGVKLIFRDVIQTGSIDLYYLKKNF